MSPGNIDSVIRELAESAERLQEFNPPFTDTKWTCSLAYALSSATQPQDVAVLSEGKVTRNSDDPIVGMVLTAMRFDPSVRCIAVFRYSQKVLDVCASMLMEICSFDRAREPPGISTMDWGIAFCCEGSDGVPDVIFDRGCAGKEPLIRILGENPTAVSARLNRIITRIITTNLIEE